VLSVQDHWVVTRIPNQNRLAITQQNSQQVGDSTIVIQMLAAGVCGTDLAMLAGNRSSSANVLGHEGVGRIIRAPEDCRIANGMRVVVNPVHRARPESVIGHSCDGVFREQFWLDATEVAEGGLLVPCPAEGTLTDIGLVLAEPVASVLYSFELLGNQGIAGPLLIRGSGTIGILAAKLWTALTKSPATMVSLSEAHAGWLRETIAWPTSVRVTSESDLTTAQEDEFKTAILCCSRESAAQGLRYLMDVVSDGATIDLMAGFPAEYRDRRLGDVPLDRIRWNNICGTHYGSPTTVMDGASGKKLNLLGHRGTAEGHVQDAIALLSRGVISVHDIPHRLFSLRQLPDVIQEMVSSQSRHKTQWIKGIVTFRDSAVEN